MRTELLAETYLDVKSLLASIAKVHCHKFGGHLEDIQADANSLFVEAYDNYDSEKGEFFNWVKYFVWIRLLYSRRIKLRESVRYEIFSSVEENLVTHDPHYFDLEDFIGGISQDAGYVVRLAVNPPKAVLQGASKQGGIRHRGNKGGTNKGRGRPKTIAAALRRYLQDLGWATRRVAATFKEIREAL